MKRSIIKVDIQAELDAAKRGECLCCRIGATHPHSEKCDNTNLPHVMVKHIRCGYMYSPEWFSRCPICNDDAALTKAGMEA